MNCKQFEELAHDIAAGKLADAALLRDARAHADSCSHCETLFAETRTLQTSLNALRDHDRLAQAPVRLETSLRAAFVRAHTGTALPRPARPWAAVAGVAAVMLFAAVLVAHYLPRWLNHPAQQNPVAVSPAPPAPTNVRPAESAPSATNTNVARNRPHRRPRESETLSEFVPLPYADDLSTIDYGVVVRYQLPRSALAWLGLSTPISDSGEMIVADLFVNQSGTPQAIRFVR
jgi:hypothetical protein